MHFCDQLRRKFCEPDLGRLLLDGHDQRCGEARGRKSVLKLSFTRPNTWTRLPDTSRCVSLAVLTLMVFVLDEGPTPNPARTPPGPPKIPNPAALPKAVADALSARFR